MPPRRAAHGAGEDAWLWDHITHLGNGCWLWRGRTARGLPVARVGGTIVSVRRVLYQREYLGGQPLAATSRVAAGCGERRCVSPFHATIGPERS